MPFGLTNLVHEFKETDASGKNYISWFLCLVDRVRGRGFHLLHQAVSSGETALPCKFVQNSVKHWL
jgi:hypothetical protein